MRLIDSHVHFWRIDAPGHSWPDADWPRLNRDFLPADLHRAAAGLDLIGAVLVQAQPNDRDTDWMLTLDDQLIAGVVGWVDLASPQAPDRIATLAAHRRFRGVRPMLQGIADTEWILRSDLDPAIEALCAHGLRFDALVEPRHLPVLHRLATRWPNLPIVIDHAAKPRVQLGEIDPWRDDIATVAALPNVWCKLSGLRTEQAAGQTAPALRPYVEHLLAVFPDRLMWGGDWPVVLHVDDQYADWVTATRDLVGALTDDACSRLFATAAVKFYSLDI